MDPSLVSITNQFDPRIAAILGWVVVIVKVLVDWLKTVTALPSWAPPAVAFGCAYAILVVLMVAIGIPLTPQLAAQGFLSALVATVLAIGQTALQNRTKPSAEAAAPSLQDVADELERRLRETPAERDPGLISMPPRFLERNR